MLSRSGDRPKNPPLKYVHITEFHAVPVYQFSSQNIAKTDTIVEGTTQSGLSQRPDVFKARKIYKLLQFNLKYTYIK